jgi:hypothetical protein
VPLAAKPYDRRPPTHHALEFGAAFLHDQDPQRMAPPDPGLQINVTEQRARPLIDAAHLTPKRNPHSANHIRDHPATGFSTAC